jgi:hypothetical protein
MNRLFDFKQLKHSLRNLSVEFVQTSEGTVIDLCPRLLPSLKHYLIMLYIIRQTSQRFQLFFSVL